MLRAGRITGGRTTPGVFLVDEFLDGEGFGRRVTPEFLAHFAVKPFGAAFREAVCERLDDNLPVRVLLLEGGGVVFDLLARRDGEGAEVVALLGGDEVGQRTAGVHPRTLPLVTQEMEATNLLRLSFVGEDFDVVADAPGRPESSGAPQVHALVANEFVEFGPRSVKEITRFAAVFG